MKKIIIIFIFLFSGSLTSQIQIEGSLEAELFLPCKFSWNEVKTKTGTRNFTAPPRNQLFLGPCLTFATISTIESTYMIEHNDTQSNLKLADPYLDFGYRFNPETVSNTFKIPLQRTLPNLISVNQYLNGAYEPSPEYYAFKADVLPCISQEKDFQTGFGSNSFEFIGCGDPVSNNDYVTVGNIIPIGILDISIKKLKELIISKGPIIMKVDNQLIDGMYTINRFRNYGSISTVAYHAYSIIGWEDQGNETRWILKDSWQNQQNYIKTDINLLSNAIFMNLTKSRYINNATFLPALTFYRVENVKKNNITPTESSKFTVNRLIQCSPIPLTLSAIHSVLHSATIDGVLYSKLFITSNVLVDDWQWRVSPSAFTRNLIKNDNDSSILVSPVTNGLVKIEVRAKNTNTWTNWKSINIQLSNGNSGGLN